MLELVWDASSSDAAKAATKYLEEYAAAAKEAHVHTQVYGVATRVGTFLEADAIAALLKGCLPNIQEFHLGNSFSRPSNVIGEVLQLFAKRSGIHSISLGNQDNFPSESTALDFVTVNGICK